MSSIYFALEVVEMIRPAANAPVISATPKNSSAQKERIRHRMKAKIG